MRNLLYPPRVPEPEVMEEAEEVDSYADAAAARHLSRLDGRFVRRLLADGPADAVLDVGCGPGQILLDYLRNRRRVSPKAFGVGIDLSFPMVLQARQSGLTAVAVAGGEALPFAEGAFDLVFSNSVLHHMARPERDIAEMARCVRPGGKLLIRDLRRPPWVLTGSHIALLGRHYAGRMRQLFEASVRAAYTPSEARGLLSRARTEPSRVRRRGLSYLEAQWTRPRL